MSTAEAKYPLTVMFFLMCRSCVGAAFLAGASLAWARTDAAKITGAMAKRNRREDIVDSLGES